MIFYFGKQWRLDDVPPLCINSRNIERVVTFNMLGVVISSDLTWDAHILYILSKCAKRIYCRLVWNLSKAGVPACDVVYIYCSVVRSLPRSEAYDGTASPHGYHTEKKTLVGWPRGQNG